MANTKMKKEFAMNDEGFDERVLDILDGSAQAALDAGAPPRTAGLAAQVDEVVQGLSGARASARVYRVDLRQLEPYPDQPFQPYPQSRLEELAEDIRRVGILNPILARRRGGRLQILAGHNRWQAARLAGLTEAPVLIVDADDDQAVLIVTSTNLRQREKLLPSEKAFAYKLQMDALKRQGRHSADGYSAASLITEQTGDSRMQIHRYIRLTTLQPGLLEMLDRGRISMTPAVSLSFLTPEDQRRVLTLLREFRARLTIDRAARLKALALERGDAPLGDRAIDEILLEARPVKKQAPPIRYEALRGYLPDGMEGEQAEQYIIKALAAYRKAGETD